MVSELKKILFLNTLIILGYAQISTIVCLVLNINR